MPTLAEIKHEVQRLAAKIGASEETLPTFGRTEDFARPHIEVNRRGLHYVVVERGTELSRQTTSELDELLFWVFSDVTFMLAGEWELAHRIEGQDSRRLRFRQQFELLSTLSPAWGEREAQRQNEILKKRPYDDFASIRADFCKDLRNQGHTDDTAWQMACERYPLPSGP